MMKSKTQIIEEYKALRIVLLAELDKAVALSETVPGGLNPGQQHYRAAAIADAIALAATHAVDIIDEFSKAEDKPEAECFAVVVSQANRIETVMEDYFGYAVTFDTREAAENYVADCKATSVRHGKGEPMLSVMRYVPCTGTARSK